MSAVLSVFRVLTVLAAVTAPVVCSAARGGWWLDVNVGSKHSKPTYQWRGKTAAFKESNLGLGATYELAPWCDVKGGWFHNSYGESSGYLLLNPKWNAIQNARWSLSPGVAGGLVSGYENTPEQTGEIAPWGMLTLSVRVGDGWRINLGYIPSRLFVSNWIDVGTLQLSLKL